MEIIKIQNGNFKINETITVGKDKTFEEILKEIPLNRIWDVSNGYKWMYIDDVQIELHLFIIAVCFYNNSLFSLEFCFAAEKEGNLS